MPDLITLEDAIRHSGEGWIIDLHTPKHQAIPHIIHALSEVRGAAAGKNISVQLTPESLVQEYNRFPLKVKGFFQFLGGTRTAEILLMAWRIIQGMKIRDVAVSYQRQARFEMSVVLVSPHGEVESYSSRKIQDFVVFRHIGVMEIGECPVFDGFYALNIRKAEMSS